MNLLCPHCQQMVTISDQYAGQVMKCPLCANTFTAPALPGAATAPVAAPPSQAASSASPPTPPAAPAKEDVFGFATPVPPRVEPAPPKPAADTTPPVPGTAAPVLRAGYSHSATIWISPRVVPWITPLALIVIFILLFNTWIDWPGKSDSGQTGWGTGFGANMSVLGLFYVLLLVLTLLLSIASVVLPRLGLALPPVVQQLWPWRSAFVFGFVALSFVFLVLQALVGFGLENATDSSAYNWLHRTFWLRLAVLCHTVALLTSALEFWLVVRKDRPLPRIDISW
jgi:hypothetical protein